MQIMCQISVVETVLKDLFLCMKTVAQQSLLTSSKKVSMYLIDALAVPASQIRHHCMSYIATHM